MTARDRRRDGPRSLGPEVKALVARLAGEYGVAIGPGPRDREAPRHRVDRVRAPGAFGHGRFRRTAEPRLTIARPGPASEEES